MGTVYATATDFGRYGLPPKATAGIPVDTITAELSAASSQADAKLRSVFTLPLTAWDVVLTQLVCQLAAPNLLTSTGANPENRADAAIFDRGREAMRMLERIADGKDTIAATDSSHPPQRPEGGPVILSDPPRGWGFYNL